MIIAVDGPAASGKGTIAKALAAHYQLPHLDTGLLYRAVALNLLRWGGDPSDEKEALAACDFSQIDFDDPELKSEAAGGVASRISVYPLVRAALIKRQRDFAEQPSGAVLDGRDIGTVIAPQAEAKLFVTAKADVRARRRHAELTKLGLQTHLEDVLLDIQARDERDRTRDMAPLQQAEDADLLDTSEMAIDAAVQRAIALVEARLGRGA
ncbi:(d)CMP kinase [Sphingosinicella rhizophila]|uniref:Cytidylate kinase n=1 Tax=Sphingosinicella rhizophila TaxID=3050082 RepID=A0ABU3Q4R3_9SPHN|nr:(d)CMP kinase [Sphingosinicella sp. GR2756]MDT9598410.1 (d)CMP kinase [Sphingosinicella sp. GR2756]